jgi:hypothetical protein
MSVSALTYASENWKISLSDKWKTEFAKMWFLYLVAGYTLLGTDEYS